MNSYSKHSKEAIEIDDYATTAVKVAAKLLSSKLV